ncbi:MAG: FKBP-type peptidyl-prolyl cis-trans isomerase [Cyclobacteriaceae bacterium]|nr:FKBP-type peptidyl-prolyl cis-trans isomerase [Cyclobacteriaceae bacterium]
MKKSILFLLALVVVAFSCKKDDEATALPFEEQLAIDLQKIDAYLEENSITDVLKDCRTVITPIGDPCNGDVSYVLQEEGGEAGLTPPDVGVKVIVSYKGFLMETGVQFDENDTIEFSLGNLITGWQVVLLDMQEGDSVTMYIPSGYGYGFKKETTNDIPSNANLIFQMKLHQVN